MSFEVISVYCPTLQSETKDLLEKEETISEKTFESKRVIKTLEQNKTVTNGLGSDSLESTTQGTSTFLAFLQVKDFIE